LQTIGAVPQKPPEANSRDYRVKQKIIDQTIVQSNIDGPR
jgi:hypothetical protein